jgi:hypothetical protein
MEEITQSGFDQAVPTIACGNISITKGKDVNKESPLVIQVTRSLVIAANISFAQRIAEYSAPATITVASVSGTQVCFATQGGQLFILSMMENGENEAFYEVA